MHCRLTDMSIFGHSQVKLKDCHTGVGGPHHSFFALIDVSVSLLRRLPVSAYVLWHSIPSQSPMCSHEKGIRRRLVDRLDDFSNIVRQSSRVGMRSSLGKYGHAFQKVHVDSDTFVGSKIVTWHTYRGKLCWRAQHVFRRLTDIREHFAPRRELGRSFAFPSRFTSPFLRSDGRCFGTCVRVSLILSILYTS